MSLPAPPRRRSLPLPPSSGRRRRRRRAVGVRAAVEQVVAGQAADPVLAAEAEELVGAGGAAQASPLLVPLVVRASAVPTRRTRTVITAMRSGGAQGHGQPVIGSAPARFSVRSRLCRRTQDDAERCVDVRRDHPVVPGDRDAAARQRAAEPHGHGARAVAQARRTEDPAVRAQRHAPDARPARLAEANVRATGVQRPDVDDVVGLSDSTCSQLRSRTSCASGPVVAVDDSP